MRPGIISLMQTHSGTMDWNCHLHMVVTDGLVDYTDPACPKFKQCAFWDIGVMTELFRLELLKLMIKDNVLPPDVPHSALEVRVPVKPKWAALIAKVFGELSEIPEFRKVSGYLKLSEPGKYRLVVDSIPNAPHLRALSNEFYIKKM